MGRFAMATGTGVPPAPPSPRLLRELSPRVILGILIIGYALLAFELSSLRYVEFGSSNFDLGIYQQSLSSYAHGRGFFEAGDFEKDGATSFLRIHPAPVMYLLAPVYAAAPSAATLFALQAIAVALAAWPLARIAEELSGSRTNGLVTAALYLLWAPLLAGNLFDFHLESFLPVELATVFWLALRGHLLLATVPAALACGTIEAGTVWIFLIGLFFLLFPLGRPAPSADPDRRTESILRRLASGLAGAWDRLWTTSLGRWAGGMMVLAAGAYLALQLLSAGAGSFAPALTPRSPGGAILYGPPQLGLSFSELGDGFGDKLVDWIVVLALVAFLPLRAPRTWTLLLPWMGATFFAPPRFISIGNSDLFLAAFPIFIGVAFGLASITTAAKSPVRSLSGSGVDPVAAATTRRRSRQSAGFSPLVQGVLLIAVASNLLLSPIDPLMQGAGGAEFTGNGYNVTYQIPRGFAEVQQIVGQLPAGASVLSSDVLFPFVANDPNAFDLLWLPLPPPFLPFDPTHLPKYVLIADSQFPELPGWLADAISNRSEYGVKAWAGPTTAGWVVLYEAQYDGPSVGNLLQSYPTTTFSWPALVPGDAGQIVAAPNTSGYYQISSRPGVFGVIWSGPFTTLPPGRYVVSVRAGVQPVSAPTSASEGLPAFELAVESFGRVFGTWNETVREVASGPTMLVSVPIVVSEPTPWMEFRGAQLATGFSITLESVTVSPTPF